MNTTSFKGINNVTDPMRLDLSWLVQADNVDITDTGALVKRDGYVLVSAGVFSAAYSTLDFSRMYLIESGVLRDFTGTVLRIITSPDPMYWCEVNNQVFFNNGIDRGVIMPDNTVLDWDWPTPGTPVVAAATGTLAGGTYQVRCTYTLPGGRETGAGESAGRLISEGSSLTISDVPQVQGLVTNVYVCPADSTVYQLAYSGADAAITWGASQDYLGRDLTNNFLDPMPEGTSVIQIWRGCAYAAQYMPAQDQTVVWYTEPLGFHLFNLNSDFFMVPGRVTMLAPHDAALIVGTASRIYAYNTEKIEQLADYGVVPGQHWDRDEERILFWTTRGLCAAMPFANLTEKQISVAPGVHAGGCVVRRDGQKRYLVVLQQGGSVFNQRTP